MIRDRDRLLERIGAHRFCRPSDLPTSAKINALAAAVSKAVLRTADRAGPARAHLAFSGGVDSSVVLYKMVDLGLAVTAHTMANTERHPDLVYARRVVASLQATGADVEHREHILRPTDSDTAESNRLLGESAAAPDNYFMLMKVLAPHASHVVCCDCIDELLGGYHMHREPARYFPYYDASADLAANRLGALGHYMSRLQPDHLESLQACSDHFGITVHEPYGDAGVMEACEVFTVDEMVDDEHRKKPVYQLASEEAVYPDVLTRRKYGLVSAFHEATL